MTGGLGPLQEMGVSGALEFQFNASGDRTDITLTYRVSGASFQKLDQIAGPVEEVLRQQLFRLKSACDTVDENGGQKLP